MFQSLLNTRHCSSKIEEGQTYTITTYCFNPYSIQGIVHLCRRSMSRKNKGPTVSILTQYKALFIRGQLAPTSKSPFNVSILTQYKALFIAWGPMADLLEEWGFNPYSIQGIVHRKICLLTMCLLSCFNPYSIQGIVHR